MKRLPRCPGEPRVSAVRPPCLDLHGHRPLPQVARRQRRLYVQHQHQGDVRQGRRRQPENLVEAGGSHLVEGGSERKVSQQERPILAVRPGFLASLDFLGYLDTSMFLTY